MKFTFQDMYKQVKEANAKSDAVSKPSAVRDQAATVQATAKGSNDCPLNNSFTIRLICDGKAVDVDVTSKVTYEELQSKIEEHFSVKPNEQIIKVGYPRRTLQKPDQEGQPIGFIRRETVIVDRMKVMPVNKENSKGEGAMRTKHQVEMEIEE